MESTSCKNVWVKKNSFKQEGTKSSCRNKKLSEGNKASVGLTFGSSMSIGSSKGPSSLPDYPFKKEKSKLYCFEVGPILSSSSQHSCGVESGPSSLLTFGMEAKKYRTTSVCFSSMMEVSSRGLLQQPA